MSAKSVTTGGPSAVPFLVAVVAIVVVTLGAAAGVYIKGGGDSAAIVIAIFGFVGTSVLVPLYNAYQTRQVAAKVEAIDTKVDINTKQTDGKLNALMEAQVGRAAAEGMALGITAQREQASADTLALAEARALLERQRVEMEMLRAAIPPAAPAAPVAPIPVVVTASPPQDVRVVQGSNEPVPVHITAEEGDKLTVKVVEGIREDQEETKPEGER